MTGTLEQQGIVTPFSRLSGAAMVDLNYLVNLSASDSYSQTFSLRLGASPEVVLAEDNLVPLLYSVDAAGRIVRRLWPR